MTRPRMLDAIVAVGVCAIAGGCGGATVEGTYTGRAGTLIDSLTFKSGGKVDVVLIGVTHEGTYEIDGGTVTIVAANGTRTPLTIASNGCLEGGGIVGTYCKDGSAPAAATGGASSSGGLVQLYEATTSEGRITLAFGAGRKVQLTMVPTGSADTPDRMSFDVAYETSGDEITVTLPGSEALMLTRTGDDLEGTMNGETVRFVKR